jgi:predicted dehydrogenase
MKKTVFIIGIHGRVAQRHIKAWKELGWNVVGCGSKENYRIELYSKSYDLIDICTPVYLHAEMIKAASYMNVPILCEKPLAINVKEAKDVLKLPNKIGIIYQFRFNPKVLKLKREVEEGKFGDIKLVTANYYRFRGPEYYQKWEADKFKAGGGVLLNVCIHYIDLFQWIFGYPTEVKGMVNTSRSPLDVENNAIVMMRFPTGAIGNLVLSTTVNPPKHFEFSVYGTKGNKTIQLRQNEYHKNNFEAFLNDKNYLRPLDALKSLQICEDVYSDSFGLNKSFRGIVGSLNSIWAGDRR